MNNRCKCDNKRKRRRTIKRILIAIILALLLHGYTSNLNATIARQGDRIRDINNELRVTQAALKSVNSRVSTVQAAVVETKVALSTKESAETVSHEVKPVETAISPKVTIKPKREVKEVTYVDPVSATTTAVLVGALQIGKHVIMEGGRIYDGIQ